MAIPPEFSQYFDIEDQQVTVCTMHPEDREIEDEFVKSLSDESRYYRFHGAMRQLTPYMLEHFTHPEYPAEMALIATIPHAGAEKQIGVVRYARPGPAPRLSCGGQRNAVHLFGTR